MAKIDWTVYNLRSGVDISNQVLSMNIAGGREKYLDTYSGGTCVFTINNASNVASNFVYGDNIFVANGIGPTYISLYFWVQEVVFDDHPGNTGLNTATITCVDFMSRAGRINANALVLAQNNTLQQAQKFNANQGGPIPTGMNVGGYSGSSGSIAAATTYTGSVNNYLNLLVITERGYVFERAGSLRFVTRNDAAALVPPATTIGRTTSSSQIAYQTFERIQNGTQFINTATISPEGLASQTVVNSTSLSAYGPASYSSSTVDYTTTQATGNGEWIVNNFGDPSALRFACGFNDLMQNSTALTSWISEFWGLFASKCINFSYQVPGGSLTTIPVIAEGYEINVTPEQTAFRLTFSPLQYYQFFTLDSTTLGILDTSRLGW
jgi:hypothetical protein